MSATILAIVELLVTFGVRLLVLRFKYKGERGWKVPADIEERAPGFAG